MTVASTFQDMGLSVKIYKPSIAPLEGTYEPYSAIFADDVIEYLEGYSHSITVDKGFSSASITVKIRPIDAEKWFETILGYSVVVTDQNYDVVFEGIISTINLAYGTYTAVRGPLFDIANRIIVQYTPVDFRVDPPVEGSQAETIAAEDINSQSRYGILETIISGGKLGIFEEIGNDADKIRDTYLQENKDAQTSNKSISIGTSTEFVTVSLECVGFGKFLEVYVHNYTTLYTITVGNKIKDIIEADPNGIISRDFTSFEDNVNLTSSTETANKKAYDIIKGLLTFGDDYTDNRRTFGIYENRLIHYKSVPEDIAYYHNIRGNTPFIADKNQNNVFPWSIRPAQWLQITGLIVSAPSSYQTLRDDPRNVFIENVSFTAPFDLSVNGMKLDTVPQMLAKYGLGGMTT